MAKKSFKIRDNLVEALRDTVASAKNNAGELHIEIIPLKKIILDLENPRDLALTFNDLYEKISKSDELFERKNREKDALTSLTKSIEEQGVINPIVVYKYNEQYKLIAGERRTLASILAKKEDIPAKILTRKPDQLKLSLIQWIENVEREDLSLWERIRNLEKILFAFADTQKKSPSNIKPAELSRLLGCSLQQGVNYRHALNASEKLRKHIQNGEIKNIEKVALIAKSPTNIQTALIEACIAGASLSKLKTLASSISLTMNESEKINPSKDKKQFSSTVSTKVAKTIISAVLDNSTFQHFNVKLGEIQWDNHQSISLAFRRLLKLLEQA